MFTHPFHVTSSTVITASDSASLLSHLREGALQAYENAQITRHTFRMHSGEAVNTYAIGNEPIFFESVTKQLFCPSVYVGWQHPNLLPTIYVSENSIPFLCNGSDVMRPAVLDNELYPIPNVSKEDLVFISVRDSASKTVMGPYGVGKASMSTAEMYSNQKGKCVDVLHLYRDKLWAFGSQTPCRSRDETEHFGIPGEEVINVIRQIAYNDAVEEQVTVNESEDELLRRVFLYTIGNKIPADQKYPIDAGQFYSHFILKSLPEGRRLDIKKTSWKKFTVFLNDVNSTAGEGNWFVRMDRSNKNHVIVELNQTHPEVLKTCPKPDTGPNGRVEVAELVTITDLCLSTLKTLVPSCPYHTGDRIPLFHIARAVFIFVFSNKLLTGDKDHACMCTTDATLARIMNCRIRSSIHLHEIVSQICATLQKTFVISAPDGSTLMANKLPMVEIVLARTKKDAIVTKVTNMDTFGIDVNEMISQIPTGDPKRTFVPNGGSELMIKGDQLNFVSEFLQKYYGMNKRYIKQVAFPVKAKKGRRK
uniref:SUI1 domain-containing protein n=1 Tax=Panagrellus redivivus TaxID=6233 RepID=A0A7E4VA07_PANRE